MPWVKGQSGNPKGRPRNTAAVEIREELQRRNLNIIKMLFDSLQKIEDEGQKVKYILHIMEFLYPKPKEIDISIDEAKEVIEEYIQTAKAA